MHKTPATTRMDSSSSQKLPLIWLQLIAEHLASSELVLPHLTEILPRKLCHCTNPTAFLLPPFLPWSPQEMYDNPLRCPLCPDNQHVPVTAHAWTLGQSGSPYQPRFLHGVNAPTILISRVYKCPYGHVLPAHSSAFLAQIPSQITIPFHLSHRSGFTHDLEDFIRQHLDTSVSARRTCQFLASNRCKFHHDRSHLYSSISHTRATCPSFTEWQQFFPASTFITSHAVLIASYVRQQELDASMYHLHMANTSITNETPYLTCDHTFKTAGMQ